jgi:TonB-dependent starch-binding outer membrane protein SusC
MLMPLKKYAIISTTLLLLALLFTLNSSAQQSVSGKVINKADNQPLVGATVKVDGANSATQTNADGSFVITSKKTITSLTISAVGFETLRVPTGGKSELNTISLTVSTTSLNDIVVTGYTAQKKKEITGAVSIVNMKDVKQTPAGTGEELLQGRASGLTIISSGQPGAASDIRIRGVTTFGNNQPLIIVDGIRGDLHNINPNDIESMQVLKDASASIYGVAGANGVIVITTKKGKSGKAVVAYDAYYGVTTQGPGFDMANPTQEAHATWQAKINAGLQPGDANWGSKQYGTGVNPVLPDYITPTGYILCNCAADSNFVSPSLYNINTYQITKANKAGTNWYKAITRNAQVQSHNISVSSGSDKSSYFFSFGYLDQQGIADYNYLKRYSVRANTVFNVANHIRVGENAYIWYKRNPTFGNQGEGSPFSVSFREDEIIPIHDIMGNFAGTKSQDLGNAQNPYANIYRTKDNRGNAWDITGNVFAEADILKHFTLRTSFGGVVDNQYSYNFNYVGYENAEGNTGSNSFSEGASYNSNYTYTNTLTYANQFGEHSVKLLVGTEAVNSYGRYVSATRSNYFSQDPNYWIINAGSGTQSNAGGAYQSAIWSQFGKLEYNYAGKYILNASLRRDGSSVFSPDVRFGYFPAVSAAWRVSSENFMKNVTFVNDLKLRGSWGKLGTSGNVNATNPYDLYSTRSGKSAYDIAGNSTSPYAGFYKSNIGNPSTTWEGDAITNIGIDATILHNKLDFSIEWYQKKVTGLLFQQSGIYGDVLIAGDGALPQVNIASNQNTGIDFNATYHSTISRDLKLDITGIVTSYNNKILSVPGSGYFYGPTIRNVIIQKNEQGHPFGAFYGYKVIGLFQSAADVTKSPTQSGAAPGLFKYQDVNGDGKIDDKDRTYIGNPNPKFTYGLNLALTYKAFDFSAFFYGSVGNDIFNQTQYYTDFPDFFKGGIRREVAVNSWTPTNTGSSIPALQTAGSFSSDQVTNSYFISKGSYLRCKQMQIGYMVPTNLGKKVGIHSLRVYVQGANLFTITKYKGLDPELSTPPDSNGNITGVTGYGIDQGNYPHTASFLVGVNLNF